MADIGWMTIIHESVAWVLEENRGFAAITNQTMAEAKSYSKSTETMLLRVFWRISWSRDTAENSQTWNQSQWLPMWRCYESLVYFRVTTHSVEMCDSQGIDNGFVKVKIILYVQVVK